MACSFLTYVAPRNSPTTVEYPQNQCINFFHVERLKAPLAFCIFYCCKSQLRVQRR